MTKINETKARSLAKAVTARILAILANLLLFMLVKIPFAEAVTMAVSTEILCFLTMFLNERGWNLTDWGRKIED